MSVKPGGASSLSAEARETVWRIFGAGAQPGGRGSVFDHIEPMIRKHVPPADQDRAIVTISDWFESGAHARWLKPDRAESVADLVIQGVGRRRSEDAVWAIGSIGIELSAALIRRLWAGDEIRTFVDAAVDVLNQTEARARPEDRSAGLEDEALGTFQGAVSRDGIVAAFARLEEESLELVNQGLHPTIANLVDLAVEFFPEQVPALVSRLEAPTMQARAARRLVARTPPGEPGAIVGWITEHAVDTAVALAIVHVLGAARKLDDSRTRRDPSPAPASQESSGQAPQRPEDAARNLVLRLLERLATLDSPRCLRWIGEVLHQAPRALSLPGGGQKPELLAHLEEECTRLAVSRFRASGSGPLLPHFQDGLLPGRGRHWVRHQMAIARAMRESAPGRAEELARATLDEHRRQLAEQRDGHYLAPDWDSWSDREWLEGLGTALALGRKDLDLRAWVANECRDLPLSVWDAEEDPDAFAMAEHIAQHWFLVALLAIPQRQEFGRPLEPPVVRALAEAVWAHCRFCRPHLQTHPEASVAAELAARYAMRSGRDNDQWLLDQARGEGVGPGALRVLLEERRSQSHPPVEEISDVDDMIAAELVRIAVDRFDDGAQFDLESLRDWGRLWLLIGAVDPAERTAMAIVSFPLRAADRNSRILALKLLGLVVHHRKPRPGVAEYVVPLYNQLWPVFGVTPNQERGDREEIEKAFLGSDLIAG